MKFLVVVLALAAVCQAEPEADPYYFYNGYYGATPYNWGGWYGRAWASPFYARSGYAYRTPGFGYTQVDRLHKREADAEADPQLLLNAPYTATALPFTAPFYNHAYLPIAQPAAFAPVTPLVKTVAVETPAPVAVAATPLTHTTHTVVESAPVVATHTIAAPASPLLKAITPVGPAPGVAYGPRSCVTRDGCIVRSLIDHGIAKRSADAEAEADPESYYYGYYGYRANPYYYNRYYGNYHNYYNGFYSHPAYYNNFYNYPAYYNAPAPVYNAPAVATHVVESAPVTTVVQETVATPVAEVKTVEHVAAVPAATTVVQQTPYVAAPALPVATPLAAPAPAPKVVPVVAKTAKKVTYEHLGAHPIHPYSVIEETDQVVGHQVVY